MVRLFVLLSLLALVSMIFVWYKLRYHSRSWDSTSIYYTEIPLIENMDSINPDSDIVVLQRDPSRLVAQKNRQYCASHRLYYHILSDTSPYQMIHDLFHRFPHIRYIFSVDQPHAVFFSHALDLRRLLQQSGDSSIILSYHESDPERLHPSIMILRRSDIVSYKLSKLFLHPANRQSILSDPVYLDHPLPKRTEWHRLGLPVFHYDTCIYHEHSILGSRSPFMRYHGKENHPIMNVYPWGPPPKGYMEIPSRYLDKTLSPTRKKRKIPYVIHQTMETTLLSDGVYHNSFQKLVSMNPHYQYIYWDALACRDFLQQSFPSYVLKAYDTLLSGAYRADLFRYCVLYIYGGVYLDSEVVPLVPLDKIIPDDMDLVTASDIAPMGLWQGLMAFAPGHEFLLQLIRSVCTIVFDKTYDFSHHNLSPFGKTLLITGPERLGGELNLYLGLPFTHDISEGIQDTPHIRFKILAFSGKEMVTRPFVYDPVIQENAFYFKQSELDPDTRQRQSLLRREHHYSELFRRRRVYRHVLQKLRHD